MTIRRTLLQARLLTSKSVCMVLAVFGIGVLGSCHAAEPPWPTRSVKLVVPYPAGGSADLYARLLAQGLQKQFGQTFVVDNRAGATGIIGYDYIAKAAPDGYTLGLGLGALTVMPSLRKNLPFDVQRDFEPIAIMLLSQNALVVNKALPVQSVQDLVALAKSKPGTLNYASSGVGATPHLSIELLKSMAGVDMNHVPYKGDAPAIADLIGGQVDIHCTTIAGLYEHSRQGSVRALAVPGKQRAISLPDIPTMEESGFPGYEIVSWYGLIAPAGTPKDIVDKLHAAIVKLVADPEFRQKIIASGSEPTTNTPAEFRKLIDDNIRMYAGIVKAAGLSAE